MVADRHNDVVCTSLFYSGASSVKYCKIVLEDRDGAHWKGHQQWIKISDDMYAYKNEPSLCIGVAGSGDGVSYDSDRIELHPCSWGGNNKKGMTWQSLSI